MNTWIDFRLPGFSWVGWLVTACLLGLVVGSFLNVVIARLPVFLKHRWKLEATAILGRLPDEAPVRSLSYRTPKCPRCRTRLHWSHKMPVASWMWLKARCATCRQSISLRYALIEFACAALFFGCAWQFGPSLLCLAAMVLVAMLLVLACVDIDHQLLPDCLTQSLLWTGLLFNAAGMGLATPVSAIAGAALGYVLLAGIARAFRYFTGRDGMGLVDAKLLAALCAWLGMAILPPLVVLASVWCVCVGVVVRWRRRASIQPFSPVLVLGALAWLYFAPAGGLVQIAINIGLLGAK